MADQKLISALRAGDEVRGIFACVRKDRLKTRTGSPYLALELRDRSGSVQARAFRDADLLAGRFDRGELVTVVGRVEVFRDALVVEVSDIRRVQGGERASVVGGGGGGGGGGGAGAASGASDATGLPTQPIPEAEQFLPVAYRDMEELDGFLEHLAREVYDPGYRALLELILADESLRAQLRRTPCTRAGHHAYLGGLLEHTVAVATLARETCDLHRRLNSDLLITAAIVHDLGKVHEFTYGAEIGYSEAGRMLGHLQLGQQLLLGYFDRLGAGAEGAAAAGARGGLRSEDRSELETRIGGRDDRSELETRIGRPDPRSAETRTGARRAGAGAGGAILPADRRLALLNCVLAHHGPATAPGGRFQSAEALALFRINAVDAAIKGALEHGLNPQSGGQGGS